MHNRLKFAAMTLAVIVAVTCLAASQEAQDRLNWLSQQLNLTDAQKTKLQPILQHEAQQMRAVDNNSSLTQDQKHAQFRHIHQSYQPKIQAILTPEQRQKLAQMKQEYQKRMTEETWP